MNFLQTINLGGIIAWPLLAFGVAALALIIDKLIFYRKLVILPRNLLNLIETYHFSWADFERELSKLPTQNCYRRFFAAILQNKKSDLVA